MTAVDGVTFDIPRGKATGLIGPNGAGKSTVLRVMSGWMRSDAGRVMLEGEDVTRQPANVLARRGLMRTFQISSEFGHLTVLEN
ncbi:MAG: ATP-binding cassette domain-containing protein, partial [Pseudomonadota bacterium]|nr:ATP-binding cassette domain-containing protein [Pseudomonadota bacterium]